MNPGLSIHPVYVGQSLLDDALRIWFTRFRLSSHRLRIETGRWARIDANERFCQCGDVVQSEKHVLEDCPLVQHIRTKYSTENLELETFVCTEKTDSDLRLLRDILQFYE